MNKVSIFVQSFSGNTKNVQSKVERCGSGLKGKVPQKNLWGTLSIWLKIPCPLISTMTRQEFMIISKYLRLIIINNIYLNCWTIWVPLNRGELKREHLIKSSRLCEVHFGELESSPRFPKVPRQLTKQSSAQFSWFIQKPSKFHFFQQ